MKELTVSGPSSFMLCYVRWPDMAVIQIEGCHNKSIQQVCKPIQFEIRLDMLNCYL